ncbi:MAG: HAMP domain-containing sensor histidine kinase [Holophaga sp.]|nr:HAMP domain-containing sensor histidine kinase [Holophaga sp.]
MNKEQSAELLVDLLHAQRQISSLTQEQAELKTSLARRSHQMSVLQRVAEILAATPKAAQVAGVVLDVFVQEFGAKKCVVWILEDSGATYQPRAGHGLPRAEWGRFHLPAPNAFPTAPLVLFQDQWLEPAVHGGLLDPLSTPGAPDLYFVPFENQLLLMGFAIIGLETGRVLEADENTLTILERQVAVSIYNAWLFRDLAEQRDVLRTQTAELERANAALLEADRFRSEFLALTSHELRTPLTGILGFTRLVLDGLYEDEEDMRQMLADSYASGKHLLELLNDILDLAKIECGRMQIEVGAHSLGPLLDEVKSIVAAYPRKPGVELVWPGDLASVPEVLVDEGRLKQVLLNVVSNALKFTKVGSVRVLVERGIGEVSILVVDTGIGVSPETKAHLFQKFVQAEGGHAREYGGTGLGLVICKHLMEMMNGTVQLSSEGEGKGTTLTISVPIS